MDSFPPQPVRRWWPSLWFTAAASLLAQLALCDFFTFGQGVPFSIDVNPSNIWKYAYHFPPRGEFLTLNWLGIANLPPTLNPFSLAAACLPPWLFFTAYAPLVATASLLAMALFLRELDLPRPAALFGGVVYAWQGDLLPFVFPGHYGYITTWPFFALAAWAALRAQRHWAHALIAGASCGVMLGLQPDRGAMASLLIGALYFGPVLFRRASAATQLRPLALCVGTALLVSLAAFLALFQSNIVGVKLGGASDRDQLFDLATEFSLHPAETFTYLAPGVFGWHNTNSGGPYWGWIGQTVGYDVTHEGRRNLNLAISTIGTAASLLAVLGTLLLLPPASRFLGSAESEAGRRPTGNDAAGEGSAASAAFTVSWQKKKGPLPRAGRASTLSERQLFFGRLLLVLGCVSLVLSWGYHTPFYRPLFALPLMDKWRNPLKWLEIFNFAVVVLGALGVTQLVRSVADATARRALSLFFAVAVGLLFVFFLASYPLAILVAGYLNADGFQLVDIANVMHTLHVALGAALVIGILLWLAVIAAWHGDRLQRWEIVNPWLHRQWQYALAVENRPTALVICCVVLVVWQLGWVATEFVQPMPLSNLTGTNPLLDSLQAEGPLVRVAVPQPQNSVLNFYLQNQFAADRISSIDISAASRIPDTLTAFVGAFSGHTARLWRLGGVKNVAIAQDQLSTLRQEPEVAANIAAADGYTLTAAPENQPTHALVRLRDYLDKATFIAKAEVLPTDDAVLKRLGDPIWNPRASVLLSPDAHAAAMPSTTEVPPVEVNVSRYTPHEIDIDLVAPCPGYLLINDQYDPDWEVTINGQRAPLLQADYLLRAVAVAAGPSNLTLRYVAHYRVAGLDLPVILTNDLSDAVMLAAFIGGVILIRRDETW